MKGEMRTVTLETITKFWEITHESHGSDMKIFVARYYAYIGHILMKRAYLVRAAGNQFTTGHHQSTTGADLQLTTGPSHQVTSCHQFALLKNAEFMKYMEDPLACVKLGYKMAPNDNTNMLTLDHLEWCQLDLISQSSWMSTQTNFDHCQFGLKL
jgi:hypothetical protein